MQLKWRLSHARGYLELGMIKEALAELDAVPKLSADDFDVRALRALVFQETKDWTSLAQAASRLVRDCPADASWWIMWAYAVRRNDSINAAEKILLEAESNHPNEATIQYNLGCYACQQGNLPQARERVLRAITLNALFKAEALTDPDLEPLRVAGLLNF